MSWVGVVRVIGRYRKEPQHRVPAEVIYPVPASTHVVLIHWVFVGATAERRVLHVRKQVKSSAVCKRVAKTILRQCQSEPKHGAEPIRQYKHRHYPGRRSVIDSLQVLQVVVVKPLERTQDGVQTSDHRRSCEENEGSVVPCAHTLVGEVTVMVALEHTYSASTAVVGSGRFGATAVCAVLAFIRPGNILHSTDPVGHRRARGLQTSQQVVASHQEIQRPASDIVEQVLILAQFLQHVIDGLCEVYIQLQHHCAVDHAQSPELYEETILPGHAEHTYY